MLGSLSPRGKQKEGLFGVAEFLKFLNNYKSNESIVYTYSSKSAVGQILLKRSIKIYINTDTNRGGRPTLQMGLQSGGVSVATSIK